MGRVRRAVAASAAALLLAVAGCGSGDEPAGGASEDESPSAGTETRSGEPVDPDEFLALARGMAEDATTARVVLKTTSPTGEMSVEGAVDYAGEPPSMDLTMSALGSEPANLVIVDGTAYLNLGSLSQGKYATVDPDDPSSPLGDLSGLSDSLDPAQAILGLEDALTSVESLGEEDVDGESWTHYVVTADGSRLGPGAELGTTGELPAETTYDVWFDADDRLRRVVLELPESETSVDLRASAWGEPVDIEAPAPDQIVDRAD